MPRSTAAGQRPQTGKWPRPLRSAPHTQYKQTIANYCIQSVFRLQRVNTQSHTITMALSMYGVAVLLLVAAVTAHDQVGKRAIVVLAGDPGVSGQISITETPGGLLFEGQVQGLSPGKHGFHVHAIGDLSKGCASTGGHYNPHKLDHGAPEDAIRHAGDLGNIEADASGVARVHIVDGQMGLRGEHCIQGRAIVVHGGEDDLGRGGHKDSKTTGNAGSRVACGLIGVLN